MMTKLSSYKTILPQVVPLQGISVLVGKVALLEFLDELKELLLVGEVALAVPLGLREVVGEEDSRIVKTFHCHFA